MDFVLGRLAQSIREEYSDYLEKVDSNIYDRMFYYYSFERVGVLLEVDDYFIYIKPYMKTNKAVKQVETLGSITINKKGNFLEKLDILRANFEMFKEL